MVNRRVIPFLQLLGENLVKTVRYRNPTYIGDFKNTVRIFNELEVDELCICGIRLKPKSNPIPFKILEQVASECFMPLSFGGGITTYEEASRIFSIGFEKVVINTLAFERPSEIEKIVDNYGAQSVIGVVEVGKNLFGKKNVFSNGGSKNRKVKPLDHALFLESLNVGEILVSSITNDGMWTGFDLETIGLINETVKVPVIAHGGCGKALHIKELFNVTDVNAAGIGSTVVFQKKGMGVLINFPDIHNLSFST